MPEPPVRFQPDPYRGLDLAPPREAIEAALRLPAGTPARLEVIGALTWRMVELINDGDVDALVAEYHPEVVMHTGVSAAGGVWGGDFDAVYEGREAFREVTRQWFEPWAELRLELHEVIDLGGDAFISLASWHGVGRGSGVEVDTEATARYTLRDGKIARLEWINDTEGALRELGLS